MKNWKVELIAGGKFFNRAENPVRYLPGRYTFTIIIRNNNDAAQSYTYEVHGDYKFTKSQENINPLIDMDDSKLFAKNEKEFETDTNIENMQSGYRNGMWYWK